MLLSRIILEFLIYAHETFQIVVEALARFSSAAAEQAAIERSKEASWGRGLSSSFLGIWARHARLDPRDEAVEAARRAATTVKSCARAAAAPWAERGGMSRKWTHSNIVWIKKLVAMLFFWINIIASIMLLHWYRYYRGFLPVSKTFPGFPALGEQ